MITEISCPFCGSSISIEPGSDEATCAYCEGALHLTGRYCPGCESYSAKGMAVCTQCGEATSRLCSQCNAVNWSGAAVCGQCGTDLDILEYMSQHTPEGVRERMRDQMKEASRFKALEEAGSQRRMSEFMAKEEARQSELKNLNKQQQRRERAMLQVVAAVVVLGFLFVILYAVFR